MITATEAKKITNGGLEEDRKIVEKLMPKVEELIRNAASLGKSFVQIFVCSKIAGGEILVGSMSEQEKGFFEKQSTERVSDSIINGIMKTLVANGFVAGKDECGGSILENEFEMYATGKIGHVIHVKW